MVRLSGVPKLCHSDVRRAPRNHLGTQGATFPLSRDSSLHSERHPICPSHQRANLRRKTLGSSTAIVTAAERGLGIGWVSSLALNCRGRDRVVPIRLRDIPIRRVLSLVDDPLRSPSAVAAAFADWVGAWQPAPCADEPFAL